MPKGVYSRAHLPPQTFSRQTAPLRERFFSKVSPEPNGGCWLWLGATMVDGRGVIVDEKRRTYATHISLRFADRPMPSAGLFACHRCDVPNCVNPDHLFWGTQKDNLSDMARKGRHWRHKK